MPRTLTEAHEALMRLRPKNDAPLTAWRKYRELGAKVYAEVADIDRHHFHEAMSWAASEREAAEKLRHEIAASH
jgi:hypothetical protein